MASMTLSDTLTLNSLNLDSFQLVNSPVFIKDQQGRYLWANHFFVNKSAGYQSLSEITNKNDYDFSWHIYADNLRNNDRLLLEENEGISVYEKIIRHDRKLVDIITRKCPLFDKQQRLVGLIGFSVELPKPAQHKVLSDREQTCVLYLSKGYTDKRIARELNLSPRTIETYINSAKSKLQVKTRAELIARYYSN